MNISPDNKKIVAFSIYVIASLAAVKARRSNLFPTREIASSLKNTPRNDTNRACGPVCREWGITLIEMMLVVALLSIVSLALFHSLSDGIRIFERAKKYALEEDVAIFFDKISRDLASAYLFAKIPFEGKRGSVRIPTQVKDINDSTQQLEEGLGVVEYLFDSNKKKLFYRQAGYGQALQGIFLKERVLLENVEGVEFFYFSSTKDASGGPMTEIEKVIPRGVEIVVSIKDNSQKRVLKKRVNLFQGT